jgi:hypothetical protein
LQSIIRRNFSSFELASNVRVYKFQFLYNQAMTQIVLVNNPFNPLDNLERYQVPDGITPRQWLKHHYGEEFHEFDKPTVLQWNGELVMRHDWDNRMLKDGDTLIFIHAPQGVALIIAVVVAVVVGIAAYLLMPDPKIPNDQTQGPDSVYTLRGQTNRFRPNEPIEVAYGKVRHWPSYAARPYSEYSGNLQYQYSLFCLGQGSVEVHDTRLDDTSTEDFTEVELNIIPPGGTLSLIEANVFTAVEVANIELLAPNEDDYTGLSGPYILNSFENPIYRIAVDISFPQGLYKMNDEGKLRSYGVTVLFEYREIDEDGNPVAGSDWEVLANPTITRKDNTPQRITYSANVTPGRYQIRGQRTSDKSASTRVASQVRWETAKGYAKMQASFGNVTMVEMKALATNSLNDSSAKRFNVLMTRKLPTWTPGDFTPAEYAEYDFGGGNRLFHPLPGTVGNGVILSFVGTADPGAGPYPPGEVDSIEVDGQEITVNWHPSQSSLSTHVLKAALASNVEANALIRFQVSPVDDVINTEDSYELSGGTNEINEPGSWGVLTATRNPVWAFCDVFRSVYGAKLNDEFLDMRTLHTLAQTYETREDWFDWVIDGSLSIWEAAKMVLRVGRALPIPQGSVITAVRDAAQSLPAGVFNQHNIVKGSLKKSLKMFEFQPFDGIIVEYTDPETWQTKEVNCVLPGRDGLNLDRLKMPGCTDRNRAFREGMYTQARRELQRKTVTFQTGLEGHIPAYMDLISITHDTVRVGQGGIILDYDADTLEMTLSERVNFGSTNLVHKLAIRGDDGAILGSPITVTPGSGANKVVLDEQPETALDFSENRVPPLYAFGIEELWAFMGKVSSIRPIDDKAVEIVCVNYDSEIYGWEDSETGPIIEIPVIRNRSNPTVARVTIAPIPEKAERAFIDWPPVSGASSYILQTSYDEGDTWNPAGNYPAPPVEIGTNPGILIARVAPFALNGNVIYTESEPFEVGSNVTPPVAPVLDATQPPFTELTATVKWGAVSGAEGYIADIYTGGVLKRSLPVGTALRADYSFEDYTADGGTGRAIEFRVKAFKSGQVGPTADFTQTNPQPVTAPSSLAVGSPTGSNYPATWAYSPVEGDEKEFRVYASTVSGFTPGPANLVATSTTLGATIPAPTRPLYWRVAVVDEWGPELTLSTEAVIL